MFQVYKHRTKQADSGYIRYADVLSLDVMSLKQSLSGCPSRLLEQLPAATPKHFQRTYRDKHTEILLGVNR